MIEVSRQEEPPEGGIKISANRAGCITMIVLSSLAAYGLYELGLKLFLALE